MKEVNIPICSFCDREILCDPSDHHLIPRTRHKNKRNKKRFTREEVKKTVSSCEPCHSKIHSVFMEKELERDYYTVEAIKAHPEMEKFIEWIRVRHSFRTPSKKKGRS